MSTSAPPPGSNPQQKKITKWTFSKIHVRSVLQAGLDWTHLRDAQLQVVHIAQERSIPRVELRDELLRSTKRTVTWQLQQLHVHNNYRTVYSSCYGTVTVTATVTVAGTDAGTVGTPIQERPVLSRNKALLTTKRFYLNRKICGF